MQDSRCRGFLFRGSISYPYTYMYVYIYIYKCMLIHRGYMYACVCIYLYIYMSELYKESGASSQNSAAEAFPTPESSSLGQKDGLKSSRAHENGRNVELQLALGSQTPMITPWSPHEFGPSPTFTIPEPQTLNPKLPQTPNPKP